MIRRFFDTFVGSNGTDLSAHTPDQDYVGSGWFQSPANGWELDGSGAAKWAASGDRAGADIGTIHQNVEMSVNSNGANNQFGQLFRWDGNSSETGYQTNFAPQTGALAVFRIVSGSATLLASTTLSTNNTTTYSLESEAIKTAVRVLVDSNEELSTTDSTITAGDNMGLKGNFRADANGRVYDISAYDGLSIAKVMHHRRMLGQ